MTAAVYGISIEKYASFLLKVTWKDSLGAVINLTGYTAAFQVRYEYADVSPVIDSTTVNGQVVLGGVLGTVDIKVPSATTTSLTEGKAYYDLVLTSSAGIKYRILQGVAKILPGVTR